MDALYTAENFTVCHTYDTNFDECRNFTEKFVQNA